jgi:hypothetical protein
MLKGFAGRICAAAMLLAISCGAHAASNRFDFNGDGKDDILLRNSVTGETYIWFMTGQRVASQGLVNVVLDQAWQVQGVGDFDGDGKADILWRQSVNGDMVLWMMDGKTIKPTSGYVGTVDPASSWRVASVADFDGDGKADILWRQSVNGDMVLWMMDGKTIKPTSGYLTTVDPASGWQIAGVADFDGDGKPDILWRQSVNGDMALWMMDGKMIKPTSGYVGTVDPASGWQVASVADFDGDRKSDILWTNIDGRVTLWMMDGKTIKPTSAYITTVNLSWQVAGVGDYNGDGNADILWRNSASGEMYLSLSVTTPALPPLPLLVWSAGMETGGLGEWSEKVNTGNADTAVVSAASVGIPPKGGSYVMQQSVIGPSGVAEASGTRMSRYPEIDVLAKTGTTFYYSWWDFFPTTTSYDASGWYNHWQIVSKDASNALAPIWVLGFSGSGNTMGLTWSPNRLAPADGPHDGETGKRTYTSSIAVPPNQWVYFEVMITPRGDFTGAIKIWMNGQVLFDLSNIKTQFPYVSQGILTWITNNAYGTGLTPMPYVHYVDDVSLSLGRMPRPGPPL